VLKLRELGAIIDYLEMPGYPPLRIQGRDLKAKKIRIDSGISSQYISALMMIGPYLEGGLELMLTGETISASYIGLTAGLMKSAGANITWNENLIRIGEGEYKEGQYSVEPDWSAASYWFAITGLFEGSSILLKGLRCGSLQGDARLVDIFDGFGVKSEFTEDGLKIQNDGSGKDEFIYDFRDNPDLVQTMIPYCVAKKTAFRFTGCRTLRIKETDRVLALFTEMKKFGVDLQFSDNGDQITWDRKRLPVWKRNIMVESYSDHRMAMGFAPLAIKTHELEILDPMVVTKSYPGFWDDIVKAGFRIHEK
jgi:3-phosphoshikimate 1-carboxyvinyltransferase